jgi:4-diphosphocytidyl-2-C-methyl-D-erythritol kinase
MSEMFRETGWAKINLALHVRKRRADGYHELETIFAFVNQGDDLEAQIADIDALTIDGEFSAGLSAGPDNLVMQALHLLREHGGDGRVPALSVRLTKKLPVAAGIGGGSADAAAMARLVRDQFLPDVEDATLAAWVAPLGADVASCVESLTCIGVGTGAELRAAPELHVRGMPVLLVNPRKPVATGPIFKAWNQVDRGALMLGPDMRADLVAARNDLLEPALTQCAEISDILRVLEGRKAWLSRMSGSGGTCFALFDDAAERDLAQGYLAEHHIGWWTLSGELR